jgi:hypothetical protein
MPPSPVAGMVTLDDGHTYPFLIGVRKLRRSEAGCGCAVTNVRKADLRYIGGEPGVIGAGPRGVPRGLARRRQGDPGRTAVRADGSRHPINIGLPLTFGQAAPPMRSSSLYASVILARSKAGQVGECGDDAVRRPMATCAQGTGPGWIVLDGVSVTVLERRCGAGGMRGRGVG